MLFSFRFFSFPLFSFLLFSFLCFFYLLCFAAFLFFSFLLSSFLSFSFLIFLFSFRFPRLCVFFCRIAVDSSGGCFFFLAATTSAFSSAKHFSRSFVAAGCSFAPSVQESTDTPIFSFLRRCIRRPLLERKRIRVCLHSLRVIGGSIPPLTASIILHARKAVRADSSVMSDTCADASRLSEVPLFSVCRQLLSTGGQGSASRARSCDLKRQRRK